MDNPEIQTTIDTQHRVETNQTKNTKQKTKKDEQRMPL